MTLMETSTPQDLKTGKNGKVHPTTGHEGPKWEVNATIPGKENQQPLYRGWVGPWSSLDGYRKSRPPTRIQSPEHPAHSKSLY